MKPKDVKKLVDEVCQDIKDRKARKRSKLGALGVGLAVGLTGFGLHCSDTEEPTGNDTVQAADVDDTAEETTPPVDLYGVQMDTMDSGSTGDVGEDTDVGGPVDLYGIQMDTVDDGDTVDTDVGGPIDLYGVPADAG